MFDAITLNHFRIKMPRKIQNYSFCHVFTISIQEVRKSKFWIRLVDPPRINHNITFTFRCHSFCRSWSILFILSFELADNKHFFVKQWISLTKEYYSFIGLGWEDIVWISMTSYLYGRLVTWTKIIEIKISYTYIRLQNKLTDSKDYCMANRLLHLLTLSSQTRASK